VSVDQRSAARWWYRLTQPAIARELPPEATVLLAVENGTAAPIFVYRDWLHSSYQASTKKLLLEASARSWLPTPTKYQCKQAPPSFVEIAPHEAVEITEHLPRGFYGDIAELGVEVAWSDKPLLLGTPCDSEHVQALVASERGVLHAEALMGSK
jgi:hypothetical protein